jgi:PAS domain S-box-containing protein
MPIIQPPAAPTRLGLIRSFITIFAPISLLLLIIGAIHYYAFYTTERYAIESTESLNVDLAHHMIMEEIADVVRDLRFLAEHIEARGLPKALSWSREQEIADEFRIFAANKGLYDQIRYLDKNGLEIVRVNYIDGDPEIVPFAALQNKSNRYYFREALAQEQGGIYLSRFDLNVENGEIEQPFKPVIRFGAPVFDHNGSKGGIVLVNYLGARLIENFTRAAANIADHIELLNSNGYWLSSPNPEDEWGFMLGKDIRFQNSSPEAWNKISNSNNGQFETSEGLFTFTTIYPLSVTPAVSSAAGKASSGSLKSESQWKIISHISANEISFTFPHFLENNAALYLSMFGLVFFGAGLLARTRHLHQIAEAQRDYEQHFRQTMENINLAAVAVNRIGRVTFCNNYFLRITGWQRDEVIGHDWVEEFVSQESKREISSIIPLMDDPEKFPSQLEFLVKTHHGEPRLITWNNTPSFDSKGDVIGVTGIGKDITDIRRTEANLLKLSQAVEQSPSTVMITDTRGNIEYVNPKFTQVSGYDAQEVIGKNPRVLKSGETTNNEYSDLWKTVKHGGEWRGEFHNRRKNGELYWESAAISAIRNSDGEIINFLALKEDITERKRMEAEIDSQNRELAHSETLAVMGRMASMIAHDLRNPLSSVKMTLQILEKKSGKAISADTRELCQISLEQIRYMEEILSDMLSYSRPDALKPEWISIDKVIEMAISLSQRRQEDQQVKLHASYHSGLPTFYADATKLRQVFSNLISNALQATRESDKPRVNVEAMIELGLVGTSIRVDICDNGCGISNEERDKIFEPFYTTRAKGTGLGLAIVRRILEQHKATISISDNLPKGSCISVILPVSPAAESSLPLGEGTL